MLNTSNPNIKMELLCEEHTKPLFELTELNREYLKAWLPWLDFVTEINDTKTFIAETVSEGLDANFLIFYEGKACGIAGFHAINTNHKVGSIGYWLSEQYEGKGIMTEVVKQLVKMGFIDRKLNKIEIRCAEGNIKSRAIPARLGFINEATLRQCEWLYSRFVNHVVYSLLASEYSALESK